MNKSKKTQRRGRRNPANLSPNAISYSGPIMVPGAMRGEDVVTQLVNEVIDLSWSGAATTLFTSFTSVGGNNAYTGPYGDYREYRCLGMSVEYHPLYQSVVSNDTAGITSGFITASSVEKTPNGTAYVGTTLSTMANTTSCVIHESGKPFKREVKMNGAEEASWGSTTVAAVSQFAIGILLDTRATHTPSNNAVATCIIRRLMQWRNKID